MSSTPTAKPEADSSFPGGRKITHGESLSEAVGVKKMSTWNVRTMWETSRTAQVLKENCLLQNFFHFSNQFGVQSFIGPKASKNNVNKVSRIWTITAISTLD